MQIVKNTNHIVFTAQLTDFLFTFGQIKYSQKQQKTDNPLRAALLLLKLMLQSPLRLFQRSDIISALSLAVALSK